MPSVAYFLTKLVEDRFHCFGYGHWLRSEFRFFSSRISESMASRALSLTPPYRSRAPDAGRASRPSERNRRASRLSWGFPPRHAELDLAVSGKTSFQAATYSDFPPPDRCHQIPASKPPHPTSTTNRIWEMERYPSSICSMLSPAVVIRVGARYMVTLECPTKERLSPCLPQLDSAPSGASPIQKR